MVFLLFGDSADPVGERQRLFEIGELEMPFKLLPTFQFPPASQLFHQGSDHRRIQSSCFRFARFTVPFGELWFSRRNRSIHSLCNNFQAKQQRKLNAISFGMKNLAMLGGPNAFCNRRANTSGVLQSFLR
jgi:hypothetical protein